MTSVESHLSAPALPRTLRRRRTAIRGIGNESNCLLATRPIRARHGAHSGLPAHARLGTRLETGRWVGSAGWPESGDLFSAVDSPQQCTRTLQASCPLPAGDQASLTARLSYPPTRPSYFHVNHPSAAHSNNSQYCLQAGGSRAWCLRSDYAIMNSENLGPSVVKPNRETVMEFPMSETDA